MSQRKSSAMFSLIVPTLGRKDELRKLFQSLCAQSYRDFEIIVVDSNAPGFLNEVIDSYRSRLEIVHVSAKPGLAAARNVGLTFVTGNIVAFPDDDCWYDSNTLADALNKFKGQPSLAIVSGRTVDHEGKPSVSLFLERPARISRKNYLKCGNSASIFYRREVFADIGRFDIRLGVNSGTEFQSSEESDILLRALDAGLIAQFFPDLRVYHGQVDSALTNAHINRAKTYGLGFGALLRKHRFPLSLVTYRVSRPLLSAAFYLVLGRLLIARYKWTWGRSIVDGYRRWPSANDRHSFDPLDA
jgi:glycosyltransferase involved in cell wall biosynthesis